MKLRFLGGRYQGRIVDVKPDGLTIGRGQDCDLVLDEDGVSRRHCRLFREGDAWFLEDLQSTNGVRVNGERVQERRSLTPGDRVGLSQQTLLFSEDAGIVDVEQVAAAGRTERPTGVAMPVAAAAPPPPVPPPPPPPAPPPPVAAAAAAAAAAPTEMVAAGPPPAGPDTAAVAAGFPWGRAVALIVVLALLGWAAWLTFFAPGAATPAAEGGAGGAGAERDLGQLMAAEQGSGAHAKPAPVLKAPTEPPPPLTEPSPAALAPPAAGAAAAVAVVASEPAGATVLVEDREVGHTPVMLAGLAPGRHKLTLRLAGYEELVRQIHVPDLLPDKPYPLRQQAGTLMLTSNPSGAAVMCGTQILGQTPLLLTDLPPGTYEVGLMAPGCEPQKKEVTISENRGETVNTDLVSVVGGVQVVTVPAGCRVYVDGSFKGTSRSAGEGAKESAPLVVRGLREGEHTVRVEHAVGSVAGGKVKVTRGEVVALAPVRVWAPDTRVTLTDGSARFGMLVETQANGDVVLAESAKQSQTFAKARVQEVKPIGAEELAQLSARLKAEVPKPDAAAAVEPDAEDEPEAAPDTAAARPRKRDGDAATDTGAGGEAGKATGFEETAGAGGGDTPTDSPRAYTLEEVARLQKSMSNTDLDRRFRGKPLTITGVPTSSGRESTKCYINLTKMVRCYLERDAYERVKDRLKQAQDQGQPVTITGVGLGYHATGLLVRDCTVEIPEAERGGGAQGARERRPAEQRAPHGE